ncbi:MAG: hypothetical protein JXB88_09800 [Spirochaetales bacterium]|nr:hypothetical protein [Spirochaetales bacterium]
MKINKIKIMGMVLIFCFYCMAAFSQLEFSGNIKINLSYFPAFPYEDDRFDSLINPDNFLSVHDIQLMDYVTAKIEGKDDTSSFAVWFGLDAYQIAQALYAAATGDETIALAQTLPFLGTEINTIELLRANVSFYVTEYLVFCLGRQQMYTGYGYGWNPIDFANPLKDPYDPEAELKGIDAVKMTFLLGNSFSTSISGLYTGSDTCNGLDFKNIMLLCENRFWFPGMEIMLSGLYEYDEEEEEDTLPASLGLGFKINLFDIGFYGEAAARWGSRNYYYELPANSIIKTDIIPSFLVGVEYVFPDELTAILEYFYNGEGLSNDEKEYYEQAVEQTVTIFGYPSSEQISMIIPGYVNKHYILCHLLYPFYDLNMDTYVTVLFSPDGLSLNILPGVSFQLTGSLSVSFGYTGLYDFDGKRINETSLSPVKHRIEIEGSYYF